MGVFNHVTGETTAGSGLDLALGPWPAQPCPGLKPPEGRNRAYFGVSCISSTLPVQSRHAASVCEPEQHIVCVMEIISFLCLVLWVGEEGGRRAGCMVTRVRDICFNSWSHHWFFKGKLRFTAVSTMKWPLKRGETNVAKIHLVGLFIYLFTHLLTTTWLPLLHTRKGRTWFPPSFRGCLRRGQ